MRNSILKIMVALVLLTMATAWPLLAQSVTTLAKAEIPFDFVVGQKTLPAGEYEICPGNKTNKDILWIKKADSRAAANMITFGCNAKRQQAGPYLVFNRYGNQYFLSQVWTEFDQVGRQTPKTSVEKELIQAGGPKMAGAWPEVVLLGARK
ncbi:MAG TPA: hypothetical protein VMW38_18125 [Terriglobia bacterium]|nr:hypothetical protein [Terriglobia bacterium]